MLLFHCRAFAKNVSDIAGDVFEAIIFTSENQLAASKMLQMAGNDYKTLSDTLMNVRTV